VNAMLLESAFAARRRAPGCRAERRVALLGHPSGWPEAATRPRPNEPAPIPLDDTEPRNEPRVL
jgi:hypothetical protein